MIATLKEARAICGTLGFPSKMPGTSYGIPASACVTGAILAQVEGSVCHDCYAFNGNYQYSSVEKAQATRLASLTNPRWVEAMVFLLCHAHGRAAPRGRKVGRNRRRRASAKRRNGKRLSRHHRWHDAGDLQSREHLIKICAVARATPWLKHWLPTKEGKLVRDFLRDGGTIPSNLIVRLSGSMVDGEAPRALPHTSTVHATRDPIGHACVAPQHGNTCGPCRACWDPAVENVSYHLH